MDDEQIVLAVRKIIKDSNYVAPELRTAWWETKILALCKRVNERATEPRTTESQTTTTEGSDGTR